MWSHLGIINLNRSSDLPFVWRFARRVCDDVTLFWNPELFAFARPVCTTRSYAITSIVVCGYVSLCPRLFVPTSLYAPTTSLCAHVPLCPKKWYFVPTSLCAHVPLCPKKWYFVPTSLCAHVPLCPKKWYFVPMTLCAHVSLCPRLYMPKRMPVGISGRHPLCQ